MHLRRNIVLAGAGLAVVLAWFGLSGEAPPVPDPGGPPARRRIAWPRLPRPGGDPDRPRLDGVGGTGPGPGHVRRGFERHGRGLGGSIPGHGSAGARRPGPRCHPSHALARPRPLALPRPGGAACGLVPGASPGARGPPPRSGVGQRGAGRPGRGPVPDRGGRGGRRRRAAGSGNRSGEAPPPPIPTGWGTPSGWPPGRGTSAPGRGALPAVGGRGGGGGHRGRPGLGGQPGGRRAPEPADPVGPAHPGPGASRRRGGRRRRWPRPAWPSPGPTPPPCAAFVARALLRLGFVRRGRLRARNPDRQLRRRPPGHRRLRPAPPPGRARAASSTPGGESSRSPNALLARPESGALERMRAVADSAALAPAGARVGGAPPGLFLPGQAIPRGRAAPRGLVDPRCGNRAGSRSHPGPHPAQHRAGETHDAGYRALMKTAGGTGATAAWELGREMESLGRWKEAARVYGELIAPIPVTPMPGTRSSAAVSTGCGSGTSGKRWRTSAPPIAPPSWRRIRNRRDSGWPGP